MSSDARDRSIAGSLTAWASERWIALLIMLHAAKLLFWFHALHSGSQFPLINVDYVQFFGRTLRMHQFLARGGRIWGYDPFDMAGYLSGPFLEVGTHVLALAAHVLEPVLPMATTLLLIEVLGLAGAPFFLVPGARLLGASREEAWVGFGLATFLLGSVEPFSTGMYKLGLWGWMVSCCLGLPMIGLLWRWLDRPSWRGWTLFTACAALVSALHPSVFIDLVAPALVAWGLRFRSLAPRRHAALFAAAAVVFAANWFWISPFIAFGKWRVTAPYYDTAGLVDVFFRFGPFQKDFYTSVRALIHVVVLWLAIRGLLRLRERDRSLALLLGSWMGWLFVISYFGSSLPWIRTLQPGRNEFPLWILCYALAGFSLRDEIWHDRRARRIAALLGVFSLLYVFELVPGASPWSKFAAPLTNELPAWQTDLIRYLTVNKPADGRVLLECNDDLQPHFADVVAPMTGAMLIGGQHPGNFLTPRSTLFSGVYVTFQETRSEDPTAFGHRLRDLSEKSFRDYLDLYNVHMVVARTPQTLALLARYPDALDPIIDVLPHRVYRVRQPSGWFETGSGRVAFDYDHIVITMPSRGPLVLKTHWLSTFRASPRVPIRPVYLMDDPVPFIAIDNSDGHDRIEIYNAGLPPFFARLTRRFHDNWGHR